MGVDIVHCPACDAEVRIGLPKGSEIRSVKPEAERATTDETKIRPLSCPEEHRFAVEFTVG